MDYVIPAPPITALPVEGDERRFPVRRVFCVGRNYAAHAREMGHDPDREPAVPCAPLRSGEEHRGSHSLR